MPRRPTPTVAPPPSMGARDVQEIRARLGLPQSALAMLLNVSIELVQAWEAERRVPRGPALRLLEIARTHSDLLLDKSAVGAPTTPPVRAALARNGDLPSVRAGARLPAASGSSAGRRATPARPAVTLPAAARGKPASATSADALLRGLLSQGVAFVTVGGVAAQLRGAPGTTDDLDIVYDRTPANLGRLATFLKGIQTTLRGAPGTIPFAADPRTLAHTAVLALDTKLGPLDLRQRIAGIGDFAASLSNSSTVSLGVRQIPTLTLDAIIVSKRATGRSKDREEVRALEALR